MRKEDYPAPAISDNPIVDYNLWKIENGKFYLDGKWVFLKVGKPLINFANAGQVDKLISNLDVLRKKHFNAIELNCYWHHFDENGDGIPDKSLEPLNKLINAIYAKGMYPCLSVETYAVGGGTIPEGFWTLHPDAYAINERGEKVTDTEYGFGSKVVSISVSYTHLDVYKRQVWTSPSQVISAIERLRGLRPELDIEVIDAYNLFHFFKTTFNQTNQ